MVPPDDDWRLEAAVSHERVEAQPEPRPIAQAEPQDSGGQSLKRDALPGEPNPANQCFIISKHLERCLVGNANILGIARERRPAERTFSFAKQRPNVLGHEAADIERVRHAGLLGLSPDVVAVIEGDCAARLECEHRSHMLCHRRH